MKHYFCYFEESGQFTPSSRVYKVVVSDGLRDQAKKCLVDNYACDCGFFFRVWDSSTEFELKQLSSGFVSDSFLHPYGFQIITLTISELYRHIINGTLKTATNSNLYFSNARKIVSILSPKYFILLSRSSNATFASTSKRKNLSFAKLAEGKKVGLYFTLILVLFLLAGYLEGVERTIY